MHKNLGCELTVITLNIFSHFSVFFVSLPNQESWYRENSLIDEFIGAD